MASEEKKAPAWLMKNSKGDADGMWTLLVISFVATTLAYLVSILEIVQLGDTTVSFRAFDGLGYAAIVLVPLISGYFGRRYTKAQNETSMAKAKIYAEVAKRKISSNTLPPNGHGGKGLVINPERVANQIHEDAEAALHEDLEEPMDEV